MRFLKWFYPGMRVKRWLVMAIVGVFLFGIGSALLPLEGGVALRLISLVMLLSGLISLVYGIGSMVHSLLEVVSPGHGQDLVEMVFQRRHLERGPKIVVVGGGTGLSTLLHGLKHYTSNITAIVTVADDGGSSGRLRQEFDMLPPGDIRNCLVALADTEPLMQRLFQYRFAEDSALQGHSFGNLFITAMTKITGDFEQAVQASSKVLAIRGHVVPSTNTKVRLVAEHEDGSVTMGESKISHAAQPIRRVYLEPSTCQPTLAALDAIRDANAIIFGPGSLYTSIIPNLLVDRVVDAVVQSKAMKIYVCNVMTQHRETNNFKASDHLQALIAHSNPGLVQVCVVNTEPVPVNLLERYRREEAHPVEPDAERLREMGYQVVAEDIISTENYVRHDPDKVAKLIIQLLVGGRGRVSAAARTGTNGA
ncbi:MAG: YvcK family protein [Candidatus Omnitrophica bacterium]|nr:YvcK family protein [Candidatus Omnitrophota bacterium]